MAAPATLASFNALLASHARSGRPAQALRTFRDMLARGLRPDHFTLPPVLRSCALTRSPSLAASTHALSVKISAHGNLFVASALVQCYSSMSNLPDARKVFDGTRGERDAVLWTSMLGGILAACRVHGEVDAAERISKRLMAMSPAKSGYYMSMANIYSDAGRYGDAERVRGFMKEVKVDKLPGYTSLELDVSVSESNN